MRLTRTLSSVALVVCVAAPVAAQTVAGPPSLETLRPGFAQAVAVGDHEVFVGEGLNRILTGLVYVYRPSGSTWTEAARLKASDGKPSDGFGTSVAVAGGTLLVGALNQDSTRGAVYVFQKDGSGAWKEAARLAPADRAAGDQFGAAIAVHGGLALVGSPRKDSTGAVYVFRRANDGRWRQEGLLKADSGLSSDRFGLAVAWAGDRAIVGAPMADDAAGAAYVFQAENGAWSQTGRLTPSDVEKGNRFGSGIVVAGETALVSAPRQNNFIGAVYEFHYDAEAGEWQEQPKLVPFDGTRQYRFGTGLDFDGTEAWIGAPGANRFSGTVYVFRRNAAGDGWDGATKVTIPNVQRGDFASGTLGMQHGVAVIGVLGDDYGAGSALVMERSAAGRWENRGRILSEEEHLASITGGEVKCGSQMNGEAGGFDCSQVDLQSFLSVRDMGGGRGVRVNDLWGWTDPQTKKEYALVGRVDGTAFVDMTNPARPVYVGQLPKTEGSPGSVWRDIKVYKDHAFIVADGAGDHGMQVFDLTKLRSARGNAPVTFTEVAHYDKIHSAHNIVIDTTTGYAYAVGSSSGGETCGGGLHMINIQDPEHPTFAGCFADPETGRASTGYSHDAMCIIYQGPDTKYRGHEICFGSNETALSIADVTDKDKPVALSRASYPNVGYAHQGWITEDHKYFFMDDELDELSGNADHTRTLVWDVTDLDDPVLAKEFFGTTKASDHNLYIRGNTMYQSDYQAGLRVIDISDPTNPREVGYFDTVPFGENSPGFGGSWSNYPFFASGNIAVTSGNEGLFILRKRENPVP